MKKVWSMFMLLAVCLVACTNIDDLEDDVDALKKRVTALETQVRDINSNTEALRELYNEGTFITNIEEKSDSYTLTLSNGKTVNLYMKNDNNLLCPIIGIDSEGYWTVLYNKNETPERLTVNGQPVKANGESGKTPTFNVDSEGYWQVSYDGGKNYSYIYKEGTNDKVSATGDGSAPTEDKNFKSVTVENNELVLVLAGEDAPTIRIPIVRDFECSFAAEDLKQVQEFSAGEVKEFTMTVRGVENTMITAPEGWSAKFSKEAGKENVLVVTAPASSAKMMTRATADNSTDIAVLATSGKYAMIAKIQVSIKNRTDYKADFDNGKDITIGGITINNQIYSDADIQILDATDADVALDTYFSATMSKPVILFLTGTAHNFTTAGVKSISNDVIIIGQYDDEQVTLRPANCWKSCKGKLLLKNIKIDLRDLDGVASNTGYFINNAGVASSGDFTDICFDNCLIANVLKPIYYDAAQKGYFGINNISVQDTRIEVNAIKIALINIYKGFNLGDYKTFNFKNNIVYSQTP
ncbi:PL29 family lyase N-terminal domain-containing protein, partial [Bacteroides ovatus]|uniref:PL29 family lyase N-terminal domain-containing protein n=2 Tax=Bacteroides TaxID=816 RepID=UPI00321C0F1D